MKVFIKVLATYLCLALSSQSQVASANTEPATKLGLRTLILSTTDYSAILPKNILEGYGAPHDVYTGSLPDLSEDKWHSIVIADGSVDPTMVRDYAKRTSARIVILETFPRSTDPQAFGVQSLSVSGHNANLTVAEGPVAHKLAGVLNKEGSWNLTQAAPRAVIITDPSKATGFLRYEVPNSEMMGAYVTDTTYGTQEMHFTFQNFLAGLSEDFMPSFFMPDEYTHINLALGHAWYEWVTRGVYLGYRRATLNVHIDDWYIQSQLYDTGEKYRLNGTDVETYVAWKEKLHKTLPAGSDLKFEPAYNAAGISMFSIPMTDGLVTATAKYADQFYWVSHTFTHMNMDKLAPAQCPNGETVCRPTAEIYDAELTYNHKIAMGEPLYSAEMIDLYKLNPGTGPGHFLNNNTELMKNSYSRHGLVTPEISGLWPADYQGTPPAGRTPYPKNKEFFDALIRNEIYNLVGDNSRAELNVANIYHAVISTVEQYGQDGVILVPRWSPNVAFSCNSYACIEKFYADGACGWVLYGKPCPDEPMSGPEIMIREGGVTTIPLLQLRWDPYMFHQANMHAVEYDGGFAPLVGVYVQEATNNFQRFVNGLPLISYPLDVLAGMYRRRMARDLCNVEGQIEFDAEGKPTGITATGTGECEIVLTLSDSSNITFGANETTVRYGPDLNVFKNVTAANGARAEISILTPSGTTMTKIFDSAPIAADRRRSEDAINIEPKLEKLETAESEDKPKGEADTDADTEKKTDDEDKKKDKAKAEDEEEEKPKNVDKPKAEKKEEDTPKADNKKEAPKADTKKEDTSEADDKKDDASKSDNKKEDKPKTEDEKDEPSVKEADEDETSDEKEADDTEESDKKSEADKTEKAETKKSENDETEKAEPKKTEDDEAEKAESKKSEDNETEKAEAKETIETEDKSQEEPAEGKETKSEADDKKEAGTDSDEDTVTDSVETTVSDKEDESVDESADAKAEPVENSGEGSEEAVKDSDASEDKSDQSDKAKAADATDATRAEVLAAPEPVQDGPEGVVEPVVNVPGEGEGATTQSTEGEDLTEPVIVELLPVTFDISGQWAQKAAS